jgi:ATP-binding cassette subfamily F protein 3
MLHINDLVFRQGGRLLFDHATLHVAPGQKVGLVGRNGAGKSTLFRLILGEAAPDAGDIAIRPRARVGSVSQDMPDGSPSPLDFVLGSDRERSDLLDEAETCQDPYRIGEVHERLAAIDAHTAPARASAILAGLGFSAEAQDRPLSSFSGGWRMRVALAATLFLRPDILFLDEPTNHLDLEATLWLQTYLASWQGTLVVISHDRELLNEVANRIVHLDGAAKLVAYNGNYDTFERTRREKLELAAKTQSKQLEQRRKIQSFIDRFRAKATKAAQAQSRIKMLEKMGPVTTIVEEHSVVFDFPSPDPLSPPILTVDGGSLGYGDRTVLSRLDFRIDMDDRIALLGANGNGKSTLAKFLAGRLALMGGKSQRSPKLKIGYFSQDQADELNMAATAYDHMVKLLPDLPEAKVRAHLGRFGFEQGRADQKVDSLSGGEKARLLFALMTRDAPHLIILDEPTNHLDIDSRECLVSALNAYEGAVVLVSHDPRLVELVADSLWLVDGGAVQAYAGDLADYRRFLLDKAARERRDSGDGSSDAARSPTSRKDERRAAAEARAQLAPLKRKVETAEKRLDQLHGKKSTLDAQLADPSLYQGAPDKLTKLTKELADIERQLADAEADWLDASEAYETAQTS